MPQLATTAPIDVLAAVALAVFAVCALVVSTYALAQAHLLSIWLREPRGSEPGPRDDSPRITVQLPLYNEANVAARLLGCVAALEWPRDRLEIQVLDDSTDETSEIVAREVARLRGEGLRITHLQRADRTGFKAGALAAGLDAAEGELIAIFDADFLPEPDFLERAVAHLAPDVGLVQARWGHLNRDRSALTRAQALHLDAHFTLEQHARCYGGLLMGFNGTAGIWRRQAIVDAGGWAIDTLTEDLDLAYRAQLAGWSLRYVDALEAPAELPEVTAAIRTQQHRWMKGGAQVARKLLGQIWRSRQPLRRKLHGTIHLTAGSIFWVVLTLSALSPALGPLQREVGWLAGALGPLGAALLAATGLLTALYTTVCVHRAGGLAAGLRRVATDFPLLLMFCTGISLHNSRAVLQGWLGATGAFVRTPKAGDAGDAGLRRYLPARGGLVAGELLLAGWSLAGLAWALAHGVWISAAWLSFQAAGFLAIQRAR